MAIRRERDASASNTQSRLNSRLALHHARQLALCDALEAIADRLPDTVSKQLCLTVARSIFPTVRAAHMFEEQQLFPALSENNPKTYLLETSLERLRFEHFEDESFAEEVSETLLEYASGMAEQSADKLSYMLRGFFEGVRRHIAFEKEHLVPLLMTPANDAG